MRIIFLGTTGSYPTVRRNHPSIAIHRDSELFLFDCGEGTQRQMFRAKLGFCQKIFISHIHGDHILGIPGLLQTMSLLDVKKPLLVFGPKGIVDFVKAIMATVKFKLTFPLELREVSEGIVCIEKEYYVQASFVDHGIPSLAYALVENERLGKFYQERAVSLGIPKGPLWSQLQHGKDVHLSDGNIISPGQVLGPPRPGRKIVFSGDTRPCEAITKLAEKADFLIYEATLSDELADKARESGHSTPSQGGRIAKEAKVKRLVLTHISPRYEDAQILLTQAKNVFPNTCLAEDLMEFEIPYLD
ncbi:MAG: ribonuclease [Thermoproteota archaeon]|nr:ribonuclease [Thermoproteota archaeon]